MSGTLGDLTTLKNVKQWRDPAITTVADDPQLQREITDASKAILSELQRENLAAETFTEQYNGTGQQGMMLYNLPIIDILALTIGQVVVPPATTPSIAGYVWDQRKGMLYLRGYVFACGVQNVSVAYRAGYMVKAEPQTIAAASPGPAIIACSSLKQFWGSDQGMAYANGTAFVPVASSPAEGQYVPPAGPDGNYLFNDADGSEAALVTYGFIPHDVEEAATNLVILEYNRRSMIGQNSKVLAGENVNYYTSAAFTKTIAQRLSNYQLVVPV